MLGPQLEGEEPAGSLKFDRGEPQQEAKLHPAFSPVCCDVFRVEARDKTLSGWYLDKKIH